MKILCPYCLQHFDNSKAKLICRNSANRCKRETTKEFTQYWGVSADSDMARRPHVYDGGWSLTGPAKLKKCPVCGDGAPDYVCPHCHNPLPADMVKYGVDIIPVIGGPAVGKTCYIVSLVQQLERYGWRLNMFSGIESLFGDGSDIYQGMKQQLFVKKELLDKTPIKEGVYNAPWFIRIESDSKKKSQKATYLIFYDMAGEQLVDASTMRKQAAPLRYASGAIVLLDSMNMDVVRKVMKLAGNEDYEEHFDIEKTVQELFGLATNDKILQDNPIAMVFSKADVIFENRASLGQLGLAVDLSQNSNFTRREYALEGAYRQADFDKFLSECAQIDAQFKSALVENGMENLYRNNRWNPENISIFGISSLGQAPEDDGSINTETVVPYRVLDPLIWVLNKLNKVEIPK